MFLLLVEMSNACHHRCNYRNESSLCVERLSSGPSECYLYLYIWRLKGFCCQAVSWLEMTTSGARNRSEPLGILSGAYYVPNLVCSTWPSSCIHHDPSSSGDTISSILTCTSETFHKFYSGPYDTGQLIVDAKKRVLNRFRVDLESNHSKCNRYKLLMAMLDHAPTDSGKRYVATCLAIAGTKGVDTVTEMADQWLEHMFFKSE